MEITKALCLSTVHIHPTTARWLDDGHNQIGNCPFTVWEASYGYFIPVCSATEPSEAWRAAVPDELQRLMLVAGTADCTFLRLDNDGPEVDGLPVFDWSDPA